MQPVRHPSFREALVFWLKLGCISFGGPAGQIAIMHEFLVEKKRWISPSRFLHALNYCMLLPGPEAQQLATYTGWLLHGVRGGLAAGILFILPSVFILLGLSIAYAEFGSVAWVAALFYGLKPAVVTIIALALYRIGKASLRGFVPISLAVGSFLALAVFGIPFPYIILAALGFGLLMRVVAPEYVSRENAVRQVAEEETYLLNSVVVQRETQTDWYRLFVAVGIAVFLWLLPFLLLTVWAPDGGFWQTLISFFTRAAFVTFGGAYAVLPYVAQVSVERFGWLTRLQMIDGLALGETTPGPLVMVLAFVGFMGGYNHFGGSVVYGALGLLVTTYYTFLPCFLFVFAGAPFIERTYGEGKLQSVLRFITAAVVGVMANLALYFGRVILFPGGVSVAGIDWFAVVWIGVSIVALYRFHVRMPLWIAASAVAGLLYSML